MTTANIFAGIDGFGLAAESVGWTVSAQVEWDGNCQKVLAKNHPAARRFLDVHDVSGSDLGDVDVMTGGFPCQPYSNAGLKRGNDDERALFPQMLRLVRESMPGWVVCENVPGILGMGFHDMVADLEAIGYRSVTFVIPACAVGAMHERYRVWLVARRMDRPELTVGGMEMGTGRVEWQERDLEAILAAAFSEEIGKNRTNRTKMLGNTVVPAVPQNLYLAMCGAAPEIGPGSPLWHSASRLLPLVPHLAPEIKDFARSVLLCANWHSDLCDLTWRAHRGPGRTPIFKLFAKRRSGALMLPTARASRPNRQLAGINGTDNPNGNWESASTGRTVQKNVESVLHSLLPPLLVEGNNNWKGASPTSKDALNNMLPPLLASDSNLGDRGASYRKGKRDGAFQGQLNLPTRLADMKGSFLPVSISFYEQFMGYPVGWTNY